MVARISCPPQCSSCPPAWSCSVCVCLCTLARFHPIKPEPTMSSAGVNQWEMGADGRWTNREEGWAPTLRSGSKGKGRGSSSGKGYGSSSGRSSQAWTDWELTEAARNGRGSERTPDEQRERLGRPFSAWTLCDSRGLTAHNILQGEEPFDSRFKTWGAQTEGGRGRTHTSRRSEEQDGRGSSAGHEGWKRSGWTNWQSEGWSSARSDSWARVDPPSSRAYTGSEPQWRGGSTPVEDPASREAMEAFPRPHVVVQHGDWFCGRGYCGEYHVNSRRTWECEECMSRGYTAVSYTHLTLPTKRIV